MANTPATTVPTVPAHIAARIAQRTQAGNTKSATALAILGDQTFGPRISIRAGRYRLVEDGVETPVGITLDVIIVGANPRTSKIFYSKPYDSSADNVRPDCFSNDSVKPDASVQDPVNASCADCPNNVLGSKMLPSGAKSKLCADQRHLAVVPAADPNKVYNLTIPVSGMKALRDYFKELNNFGINPEEVVTELSFDEQASYPKVVFKQKGYVPEKAMPRVDTLAQSDEVKVAVRLMAPVPQQPQLPTPQAATAASVAPAAPTAPAQPAPAATAPVPPAKPAPAAERKPKATAATAPAPVTTQAPAPATAAEPAAEGALSELEAKLDSLFGT